MRWFVTTVGQPTAWLAVAGDVLVRRTTAGVVEGRSLLDGQPRWRWDGDAVTTATTDRIVVAARRGGRVTALDAATGRPRWRDQNTVEGCSGRRGRGRTVVASSDGVVRLRDVSTGDLGWEVTVGAGALTSVVLAGGQVVVADARGAPSPHSTPATAPDGGDPRCPCRPPTSG